MPATFQVYVPAVTQAQFQQRRHAKLHQILQALSYLILQAPLRRVSRVRNLQMFRVRHNKFCTFGCPIAMSKRETQQFAKQSSFGSPIPKPECETQRPKRCGQKNGKNRPLCALKNRVFDDADCTQSSIDEDWLRKEGIQAQQITLRTHVLAMRRAQVVGFGQRARAL